MNFSSGKSNVPACSAKHAAQRHGSVTYISGEKSATPR
jgi:hypothetical protein